MKKEIYFNLSWIIKNLIHEIQINKFTLYLTLPWIQFWTSKSWSFLLPYLQWPLQGPRVPQNFWLLPQPEYIVYPLMITGLWTMLSLWNLSLSPREALWIKCWCGSLWPPSDENGSSEMPDFFVPHIPDLEPKNLITQ